MEAGALDASLSPLQMKKNRPGSLLRVIARPQDQEMLAQLIFAETSTLGLRIHSAERRIAADYTARLCIRAASGRQLAGRLSGGNQQKVAIAKWLVGRARFFLFDEPTRGIDVGAKAEVFEMMDELARSGAAILMVSSEMTELLQVADRILVMRQGRISGEFAGRSTQEQIMRCAAFESSPATAEEQAG